MTERETILQNALLEKLAEQAKPRREAFLHICVQTDLGVAFTATEITVALQALDKKKRAQGLPDGDGAITWSITDHGRHYLANE